MGKSWKDEDKGGKYSFLALQGKQRAGSEGVRPNGVTRAILSVSIDLRFTVRSAVLFDCLDLLLKKGHDDEDGGDMCSSKVKRQPTSRGEIQPS